ncbi:MAG: hypothetical protein J6Z11_01265, partial [Candidatus Riflebacteria bacterium]|nr:hypothetical protein [Candidatus Riflebacteria bacterium]
NEETTGKMVAAVRKEESKSPQQMMGAIVESRDKRKRDKGIVLASESLCFYIRCCPAMRGSWH